MALIAKRRILDHTDLSDHEKKNLLILDTVRKKGPLPRADIARLVGLNIVTVTSYVDQYIKKGVIKEVGIDISSGGRKPALIDLNPHSMYAIGMGLGASKMMAVLINLKGETVCYLEKDRPLIQVEDLLNQMMAMLEELIRQSNVDVSKVYGVGLGLPGPLNREANMVRWEAALINQDILFNISISAKFEERLGLATYLDNDANAAMFGENWYGANLGLKHAVYLYAGDGCGFLLNGELYRGANGSAGEWIFNTPDDLLPPDVQAYVKNRPWWSRDLGIALRAEAAQKDNPKSKIYELAGGNADKIDLSAVVQAAEMSDPLAIRLLREGGERLGHKAALIANLFNPEVIIVGGGVEMGGIILMDALRQTVKNTAEREANEKLRIVPSQLGPKGVALGSAAMVTQNYFVGV